MRMESQLNLISVGCQVEVDLLDRAGKRERLNFVIVPDQEADFAHGYLGEGTPLGKILLGEKAGTIVPYLKDDIHAIDIRAVTKPTSNPTDDAAKKREAKMKETIREVEDTNAMIFASSFSGKWGDYDPDSIPKEKKSDGT